MNWEISKFLKYVTFFLSQGHQLLRVSLECSGNITYWNQPCRFQFIWIILEFAALPLCFLQNILWYYTMEIGEQSGQFPSVIFTQRVCFPFAFLLSGDRWRKEIKWWWSLKISCSPMLLLWELWQNAVMSQNELVRKTAHQNWNSWKWCLASLS